MHANNSDTISKIPVKVTVYEGVHLPVLTMAGRSLTQQLPGTALLEGPRGPGLDLWLADTVSRGRGGNSTSSSNRRSTAVVKVTAQNCSSLVPKAIAVQSLKRTAPFTWYTCPVRARWQPRCSRHMADGAHPSCTVLANFQGMLDERTEASCCCQCAGLSHLKQRELLLLDFKLRLATPQQCFTHTPAGTQRSW